MVTPSQDSGAQACVRHVERPNRDDVVRMVHLALQQMDGEQSGPNAGAPAEPARTSASPPGATITAWAGGRWPGVPWLR